MPMLTVVLLLALAAGPAQRIESPDMPPRDILVDFHLVVRESCGARAARERTQR